MSKVKIFVKSILIPLVVGGVVGIIMSKAIDYNELIKPRLSPPNIVFPIAWTILYILMGISYGILDLKGKLDDKSKIIYYIQLFINALWSIIFFNLKWRLFAAIWIILLAIAVIIVIIDFYSKDKVAGLIQIPYLLWVLFATYLNISIVILN